MQETDQKFINTFGKRMAVVRKEKGFTQEKLGFKVGLSPAYIGFIEQGRRNPTILNVYKISRALNISLCDLFKSLK